MTIEQRVQSNTDRIAAIEARLPKPMNTPETHPFMGREPKGEPHQKPDAAFLRVFGDVRVAGEGRVLDKREEQTWLRRLKSWEGFSMDIPQSDAVDALLDHYETRFGVQINPEFIKYGGELALVFPGLPGLGYGTPDCYVLTVSLVEKDYGIERKIDRVVELIERRRT